MFFLENSNEFWNGRYLEVPDLYRLVIVLVGVPTLPFHQRSRLQLLQLL